MKVNSRLVKTDAVRQNLNNTIAAAIRCTILRRDLDLPPESLIFRKEQGTIIVLELDQASRESANV